MLLIRDIFYCKPGKVRPLVEKFQAMNKLGAKGMPRVRVLTDVSAERYWTVVAETEVESLEQHAEMARKSMENPEVQQAMQGYHDLVVEGRREIYTIEG